MPFDVRSLSHPFIPKNYINRMLTHLLHDREVKIPGLVLQSNILSIIWLNWPWKGCMFLKGCRHICPICVCYRRISLVSFMMICVPNMIPTFFLCNQYVETHLFNVFPLKNFFFSPVGYLFFKNAVNGLNETESCFCYCVLHYTDIFFI